jgi:hypothetical protein
MFKITLSVTNHTTTRQSRKQTINTGLWLLWGIYPSILSMGGKEMKIGRRGREERGGGKRRK